jgi:hypothetical protein
MRIVMRNPSGGWLHGVPGQDRSTPGCGTDAVDRISVVPVPVTPDRSDRWCRRAELDPQRSDDRDDDVAPTAVDGSPGGAQQLDTADRTPVGGTQVRKDAELPAGEHDLFAPEPIGAGRCLESEATWLGPDLLP